MLGGPGCSLVDGTAPSRFIEGGGETVYRSNTAILPYIVEAIRTLLYPCGGAKPRSHVGGAIGADDVEDPKGYRRIYINRWLDIGGKQP